MITEDALDTAGLEWQVWARTVKTPSPTAKLILNELALLSDDAGSGIVSVNHLEKVCGVSRRQVYRVLNLLEEHNLVRREARVDSLGRQTASRFQLIKENSEVVLLPDSSSELTLVKPGEDGSQDALTQILKCCVASGWNSFSSNLLIETIAANGRRMIWSVTNARNDSHASFDDTLSLAFEACKVNAQQIIDSEYPWAFLRTIIHRMCISEFQITQEAIDYFEDLDVLMEYANDLTALVGTLSKLTVDSVTAEKVLEDVTELFKREGIDEGIVQTVNTRLLSIAASVRHSHRHTVASLDATLLKLLGDAKIIRLWMSVLVGTRRNPWSISEPDVENRLSLIKKIAGAMCAPGVA